MGSSNFTSPGLTTNKELNLSHKALFTDEEVQSAATQLALWPAHKIAKPEDPGTLEEKRMWMSAVGAQAIADLDEWFERQWAASRDFKQELIDLLDASKFGQKEYTPYQVYLKALFEYFKDDLGEEEPAGTRSAVELAEFQDDAVKKARKILARYDGILIGDSVGLGKTWIGKKLLEDYAYHQRMKALVVCPASLRELWTRELREATIPATILSQEELGQADFNPGPYGDADVILIDESHNFRNRSNQTLRECRAPDQHERGTWTRRGAYEDHPADRHAHQQRYLRSLQPNFTDYTGGPDVLCGCGNRRPLPLLPACPPQHLPGCGKRCGAVQLVGRDRHPQDASLSSERLIPTPPSKAKK